MKLVITREFKKVTAARCIPGAYFDQSERAWVLDLSTAHEHARRVLVSLFPEHRKTVTLEPDPDLRPLDYATKWAGDRTTIDLLRNVSDTVAGLLHRYQAVDLAYLAARIRQDGAAYNGWDRGLGKTLGALALADELGATHPMIVCLNSSKDLVWRPEIDKWYPGRWGAENTYDFGGSKARRDRQLKWWSRAKRGALLVHYEALRFLATPDHWPDEAGVLLVVDEAHRLSSGGTRRQKHVPGFYRALQDVRERAGLGLLLMSGSQINNSPEDLFGQLHLMYPKRYKTKWADFCDRFLQYVKTEHKQVLVGVRTEALDELREELAAFMVVRRKEDELPDLPQRIEQTLHVDLTPGQRKVYDELADRFWAELPDGETIVLASHSAQLAALRAVACGIDTVSNTADSAKFDAAMDLIEATPTRKTVIFAWHKAVVRAMCARLEAAGIGHAHVDGDVPMSQRLIEADRFKDDPDCRVLVATLKTLGESVNLQHASEVVFLESSWVPTDMEQAIDRVHRQGQEHRVTVTMIVARDTVDEEKVLPTVETKAAMKRLLFGR